MIAELANSIERINHLPVFLTDTKAANCTLCILSSYADNMLNRQSNLLSLVETAKANMVNTFEYFNLLLTEIPEHMDDKDLSFIDDLLPWSPRVQKECLSRYKKS